MITRAPLVLVVILTFLMSTLAPAGGRAYDPSTGRFMSPDPGMEGLVLTSDMIVSHTMQEAIDGIPRRGTHPSDDNPYSYARGNPLKYTDPSGHFPVLPFVLAVAFGLLTSTPSDRSLTPLQENFPVLMNTAGGYGLGGALSSAWAALRAPAAAAACGSGTGAITFGHGARHLVGTGLNAAEVEASIAADLAPQLQNASSIGSFWGRTVVNGMNIEYRGYGLGAGAVNIGTYYLVK